MPILATASAPGLLPPGIRQGPDGLLRVPAAALSVLEVAMAGAGIPAIGLFAQVPHYVNGTYPTAALALLTALGQFLGTELPGRAARLAGARAAQPAGRGGGDR